MTRMVRRNCLAPGLLALAALVMTAPKLFGQLVPTVHITAPTKRKRPVAGAC